MSYAEERYRGDEIMPKDNDELATETDSYLERMLSASVPATTPHTDALRAQLETSARQVATSPRTVRIGRWQADSPRETLASRGKGLAAAAILVPALIIGGAGAAFASIGIDWKSLMGESAAWTGWAQNPDASITYTLPSGANCELRLGEFTASASAASADGQAIGSPSIAAAIDYLKQGNVIADADVAGVLEENRSDANWADPGDGTLIPFGYGKDQYNADFEYKVAVQEAVQKAIFHHLDTLGLPSAGLGFSGQSQCSVNIP